ncbi:hypothetical protein DXG01_002116 [Tephrocybe rancida]|nr:hypothetical protein DXG01_002116 [Tephrocybe rancida]
MRIPSSSSFVLAAALVASSSTPSLAAPTAAPSEAGMSTSNSNHLIASRSGNNIIHRAADQDGAAEDPASNDDKVVFVCQPVHDGDEDNKAPKAPRALGGHMRRDEPATAADPSAAKPTQSPTDSLAPPSAAPTNPATPANTPNPMNAAGVEQAGPVLTIVNGAVEVVHQATGGVIPGSVGAQAAMPDNPPAGAPAPLKPPVGGAPNPSDAASKTPVGGGTPNPSDAASKTPVGGGAPNPSGAASKTPVGGGAPNPADTASKTPAGGAPKPPAAMDAPPAIHVWLSRHRDYVAIQLHGPPPTTQLQSPPLPAYTAGIHRKMELIVSDLMEYPCIDRDGEYRCFFEICCLIEFSPAHLATALSSYIHPKPHPIIMRIPASSSFVVAAALIASSSTTSLAAPLAAHSEGDMTTPSGNQFKPAPLDKNVIHAAADKGENAASLDKNVIHAAADKQEKKEDGLLGILKPVLCPLLPALFPSLCDKATEHAARDLHLGAMPRDETASDYSTPAFSKHPCMPLPRSLTNVTSARPNLPDDQLLTPRTPHSRSGRAEEAYTEFELQQLSENDDDQWHDQHQSVPLLSSSASDTFPINQTTGYRSRGDDYDSTSSSRDKGREGKRKLQISSLLSVSNIPLVLGSLLAGFLLFLIYTSYNRPEKLHKYLGISPVGSTTPAPHNSSTAPDPHLLISYANYTTFPLRPSEYLAECSKLNKGYMSHGGYWKPHEMGIMDTAHADAKDNEKVCGSTITYMLDGEVGLLADLALLAQVAALAREVATFSSVPPLVLKTYIREIEHCSLTTRTGIVENHFMNVRDTQPGPEPGCEAPPPEGLLMWLYGILMEPIIAPYYLVTLAPDIGYGHNLNRLRPIFKSSKESFTNTILLSQESERLVYSARSELLTSTSPDGATFDSYIALHLRRGDRKPAFYRGDHVPTENFVQAATTSWSRLSPDRSPEDLVLYVASDSASALREIVDLTSTRYTMFSLFGSANPELRALASPGEYTQKEFNLLSTDARIRATRGMIVDFALLSGMWAEDADPLPKATVCTFSSNVCKMAAVGLGWDAAFGEVDSMGAIDKDRNRWVEIDQNGSIVPYRSNETRVPPTAPTSGRALRDACQGYLDCLRIDKNREKSEQPLLD